MEAGKLTPNHRNSPSKVKRDYSQQCDQQPEGLPPLGQQASRRGGAIAPIQLVNQREILSRRPNLSCVRDWSAPEQC
jgi:hypothetical protein